MASSYPKDVISLFPEPKIPKKFLEAPVEHKFAPQLEQMYKKRRNMPNFKDLKLSTNSEKFIRLYHYRGLSKADRLKLHTQILDLNFYKSVSIFAGFGGFALGVIMFGRVRNIERFAWMQLSLAAFFGYCCNFYYSLYTTYKHELLTEELYQKYKIK